MVSKHTRNLDQPPSSSHCGIITSPFQLGDKLRMGSVANGWTGVGEPPSPEPTSGLRSAIAKFRRTSIASGQTKLAASLTSLLPYPAVFPFACPLLEEFFLAQRRQGAKRTAFRPSDRILCALVPLRENFRILRPKKTLDFFELFDFFAVWALWQLVLSLLSYTLFPPPSGRVCPHAKAPRRKEVDVSADRSNSLRLGAFA